MDVTYHEVYSEVKKFELKFVESQTESMRTKSSVSVWKYFKYVS